MVKDEVSERLRSSWLYYFMEYDSLIAMATPE
jgi:hypothetical protein